jgi:hypothetical protein
MLVRAKARIAKSVRLAAFHGCAYSSRKIRKSMKMFDARSSVRYERRLEFTPKSHAKKIHLSIRFF